MEQRLRFGLDLCRLAILKNKCLGQLWATFEGGFFMSSRSNKMLNVWKLCSVQAEYEYIWKLQRMKPVERFTRLTKILPQPQIKYTLLNSVHATAGLLMKQVCVVLPSHQSWYNILLFFDFMCMSILTDTYLIFHLPQITVRWTLRIAQFLWHMTITTHIIQHA